MDEEIKALHKSETWELVDLLPRIKVVGNKWMCKVKKNNDGFFEHYKVCLVAKGYVEKSCIDFNEIFSHVVKLTIVRVLFTRATTHDLDLEKLDIKIAFLHGVLEEESYMDKPGVYK